MGRRFGGLILDFVGVLTSNMVEVIDLFEVRERLPAGRFLRAWASPEGQELYRRLELGEISQRDWNEGFGALLSISPDNLMVLSADHGIRKPDPAIFELTLERLGVPAASCVFADDAEANLLPAHEMGMTVIHALDERETAARLRGLQLRQA